MFSRCLCLLAVFAAVQGRAVNISNTWVLPEEGFPVFYRYFRDRISWYEADAVCQFHHANLVTVDTTAQYDAVRAYLKELDITSAVWVGLIRSNPDGEFTWTDYRGMSGDGYWSSAPDARTAPLCAAANPSADYRWEARACGGPTVASFICELPVPQWALGTEGCMVRNLPALTVLYLPESAAVQLTADCGLAGVKRVQCTGSIKRELLLKNLTCVDNDDISTTPPVSIQGITWPITTESIVTDQDINGEASTEELINTTLYKDKTTSTTTTATTNASVKLSPPIETTSNDQNLHRVYLNKQINLENLSNNNEQRNDIPQIGNDVEELIEEETAKLEDERNLQHKLLHDELARQGNFENIFTQSSDHFLPPLVIAKAKISDDVTVLSLAEKHAQQLAEYRTSENKASEHKSSLERNESLEKSSLVSQANIIETTTEVQTTTLNQNYVLEQTKKDLKTKNSSPKKYNEKTVYSKGKYPKALDTKLDRINVKEPAQVDGHTIEITTTHDYITKHTNISEDGTLDLTVILKEPENLEKGLNMNVAAKISNDSQTITASTTEKIETTQNSDINTKPLPDKLNLNDEIIKITVVKEDKNPFTVKVFDVTTRNPDLPKKITTLKTTESTTQLALEKYVSASTILDHMSTKKDMESTTVHTMVTSAKKIKPVSQDHNTEVTSALVDINSTSEIPLLINVTTGSTFVEMSTELVNISTINTNVTEVLPTITIDDITNFNHTELPEGHANEGTEEPFDDLNSPLLSAASEPLHRPPRLRRPQQTNHAKKFNPFRILG